MKVGFTCSTFDLLHAGHIAMLREAKEHCEWLMVGIQTDPSVDRPTEKKSPVQSFLLARKFVANVVLIYISIREIIGLVLVSCAKEFV